MAQDELRLYAWTLNGYTVYTKTPNPSVGDIICKSDGTEYSAYEFEDDDASFDNSINATDGSTYITLYYVPL